MDNVTNPARQAGGILKLPRFLFKVVPCLTKSVPIWAIIVLGMIVEIKIGIILSICLVSSTCVTGDSIQEVVELVLTQALLRNLHEL